MPELENKLKGMNPANTYQMSLSDAQANGYGSCSKCH